jgi:regulator of nucleoside diphosphate kinase
MTGKNIVITETDYGRLRALLQSAREFRLRDAQYLDDLEGELERATVTALPVPSGIVTMNSRVRVRDLNTGHELTYQVVFPKDADVAKNRISVLAPIGTALLGYGSGALVEWRVPSGVRRWRILDVEPGSATTSAAA